MALNPALHTTTRVVGAAVGFATGSWLLASCCGLAGLIDPGAFKLDFGNNFNGIVSNFGHQLASGQLARLSEDSPAGQLQRAAAVALTKALEEIAPTAPPEHKDWLRRCIAGLKANAWVAVMPPNGWFASSKRGGEPERHELFWKLLEASLAYAAASRPAGLTLMHLSEPKLDEALQTYLRQHLLEALELHLRNEIAANESAWRYAVQSTLELLPGMDRKLDVIVDGIRQLTSQPATPKAMDRPSNAPPPSDHFFGRENVLEHIEQLLTGGRRVCLWAEGGVGKSQTAARYAANRKADYAAILWADASSSAAFRNSYESFLPLAGLVAATDSNVNMARVQEWLEQRERWLLVLDNVDLDDPLLIREINAALPGGTAGHRLATSRHSRIDPLGRFEPVELALFTPPEATAFLRQRTGRQAPEDESAFARVGELLGYLPLALEQAAAYVVEEVKAPSSYVQKLERRGLALLEKYGPAQGDYAHSVRTTWSLSMERVAARSPRSLSLLETSAQLEAAPIPYLFAARVLELTDADEVNELLTPLARYSLIRRSMEKQTYSVHRLVAQVVREKAAERSAEQEEQAVGALSRAWPYVEFANWPLCRLLLPHSLKLSSSLSSSSGRDARTSLYLLNNQTAFFLHEQGRYAEAEPLHRRALAGYEQALGAAHPDTLRSVNNLALLFHDQGRYAEAEPLHRRALAGYEQALGAAHPGTLTSVNNLATLFHDQGRYDEAESLYKRALAGYEQALGAAHPDTLRSVNNLALLFHDQGRYDEAEPLHRRALAGYEQALGAAHPGTLRSVNNLAALFHDQGRYDEAESLYKRALAGREQVLGAAHPDTLTSVNNLAALYYSQGHYAEAEPLCKRALAGCEQALGAAHPYTLTSVNNLAEFYRHQGRYDEAESLYKRALAGREQVLGAAHPDTLTSVNNLAELHRQQGCYDEAESLLARVRAGS